MPPPMHQFLGHNGFPPQPSSGNVFLPPAAAAAAGVKFSLPQFKPGTNAGNPTHIGIQSGGSFVTAPIGYAPGTAVTSGSSMGNEDLVASQLKENQIYTTGQLVGHTYFIIILKKLPCMLICHTSLNTHDVLLYLKYSKLDLCLIAFIVSSSYFCPYVTSNSGIKTGHVSAD